eukprot:593109-Prymnesium_polylepis.1
MALHAAVGLLWNSWSFLDSSCPLRVCLLRQRGLLARPLPTQFLNKFHHLQAQAFFHNQFLNLLFVLHFFAAHFRGNVIGQIWSGRVLFRQRACFMQLRHDHFGVGLSVSTPSTGGII